MLVCQYSAKPSLHYDDVRWNSKPMRDALAWLIAHECIEPETYKATDRGKAWVEHICATPLPVKQWMRPEHARKLAGFDA
jgi:hypothetical protein